MDVITEYLQEHTSVDVFNIRQALVAEKNNYPLYNVSSGDLGHYTPIGAFFAYRELMKHINIHFPEIIPYKLDDIDIDYDEKRIPDVSLKAEKAYKKLAPSFFDNVKLNRPFTWENVAFENARPDLPVILVLRDSYAEEYYIGKYFAQQFGKVILIHYLNLGHIEEYIARYKPDIVVFEAVEIYFGPFADSVAGIPELP